MCGGGVSVDTPTSQYTYGVCVVSRWPGELVSIPPVHQM